MGRWSRSVGAADSPVRMVNNSFVSVLSEPNNDVVLQGAGSSEIQLENPKQESLENDEGEFYSNKCII